MDFVILPDGRYLDAVNQFEARPLRAISARAAGNGIVCIVIGYGQRANPHFQRHDAPTLSGVSRPSEARVWLCVNHKLRRRWYRSKHFPSQVRDILKSP